MSEIYLRCEKCDTKIKPQVYENNDGLCTKCALHKYPSSCFDPRKDLKAWWTDAGVVNKRPFTISPVKYGFAKGRLAAE